MEAIAERLDDFFRELGRTLMAIDWSSARADLLKRIYQKIVSSEVRRRLGEFYTPDWLAGLIVWRALHILVNGRPPDRALPGSEGELRRESVELIDKYHKRHGQVPSFIDPTCGSFTFGVVYLDLLIDWYFSKRVQANPVTFAKLLVSRVVGMDLNPVAVVAAKTNYILQIYRLLLARGEYLQEEPLVPIYKMDLTLLHDTFREPRGRRRGLEGFIAVSRAPSQPGGYVLEIRIPGSMLSSLGLDASKLAGLISSRRYRYITLKKARRSSDERYYLSIKLPLGALERVPLPSVHRALLALGDVGVEGFMHELDDELQDPKLRDAVSRAFAEFNDLIGLLENDGGNGIWRSLATNIVLAVVSARRRFDLVVGNLPWVNVSAYPQPYRSRLTRTAKELGMSPPAQAARKLDVSVVLYAIASLYLSRDGGVVSLMVPASLFRGLHGAGWRDFPGMGLEPLECFDLENVKPFEGTSNQPGIATGRRMPDKAQNTGPHPAFRCYTLSGVRLSPGQTPRKARSAGVSWDGREPTLDE